MGWNFLNIIPVVGHVKGLVHYAMDDTEAGDQAMLQATRNTVVVGAGAVGFVAGPVGSAALGASAGALWDCAETVATNEPRGLINNITEICETASNGEFPVSGIIQTTLTVGGDVLGGLGGGSLASSVSNAAGQTAANSVGQAGKSAAKSVAQEAGKSGAKSAAQEAGKSAAKSAAREAGKSAAKSAAQEAGKSAAKSAAQEAGKSAAKSAAQEAGKSAAKSAAQEAGKSAAKSAAQEAGKSAAKSAAQEAGKSAAKSAAQEAGKSAAKSAAQEAGKSAAKSAAQEAGKSAAKSAAQEAGKSAAKSAAQEAGKSAVKSTAQEAGKSAANSAAQEAGKSAAKSAAQEAGKSAVKSAIQEAGKAAAEETAKELLAKQILATEIGGGVLLAAAFAGIGRSSMHGGGGWSGGGGWGGGGGGGGWGGDGGGGGDANNDSGVNGSRQQQQQSQSQNQSTNTTGNSGSGGQPPQQDRPSTSTNTCQQSPWARFLGIFNTQSLDDITIQGVHIFRNMPQYQRKYLKWLQKNLQYFENIINAVVRILSNGNVQDVTVMNFISLCEFVAAYLEEHMKQFHECSANAPGTFAVTAASVRTEIIRFSDFLNTEISSRFIVIRLQIDTCAANLALHFRDVFCAVYHYFKHRYVDTQELSVQSYYDLISNNLPTILASDGYRDFLNDNSQTEYEYTVYYESYGRRLFIVIKKQGTRISISTVYFL